MQIRVNQLQTGVNVHQRALIMDCVQSENKHLFSFDENEWKWKRPQNTIWDCFLLLLFLTLCYGHTGCILETFQALVTVHIKRKDTTTTRFF